MDKHVLDPVFRRAVRHGLGRLVQVLTSYLSAGGRQHRVPRILPHLELNFAILPRITVDHLNVRDKMIATTEIHMSREPRKLGDAVFAIRREGESFQNVKLCNCADCGCELTNHADAVFYGIAPLFGRIDGRPFCQKDFQKRQVNNDGSKTDRDRSPQHHRVTRAPRLDADRTGSAFEKARTVAQQTGARPVGPNAKDAGGPCTGVQG